MEPGKGCHGHRFYASVMVVAALFTIVSAVTNIIVFAESVKLHRTHDRRALTATIYSTHPLEFGARDLDLKYLDDQTLLGSMMVWIRDRDRITAHDQLWISLEYHQADGAMTIPTLLPVYAGQPGVTGWEGPVTIGEKVEPIHDGVIKINLLCTRAMTAELGEEHAKLEKGGHRVLLGTISSDGVLRVEGE